ncbi:hypothetical protein Bca101_009625 [Brassica carinata]
MVTADLWNGGELVKEAALDLKAGWCGWLEVQTWTRRGVCDEEWSRYELWWCYSLPLSQVDFEDLSLKACSETKRWMCVGLMGYGGVCILAPCIKEGSSMVRQEAGSLWSSTRTSDFSVFHVMRQIIRSTAMIVKTGRFALSSVWQDFKHGRGWCQSDSPPFIGV